MKTSYLLRGTAYAALVTGLSMAGALAPTQARAQSAQPGAAIELDPIILTGEGATLAEGLRDQLEVTPGASAVVGAEDIEAVQAPTVAEAMIGVPGFVVQEFFGGNDQPRFEIRGSALQQNPTERGLLVMQNGMPVNRADGSYIAGIAAPGMSEAIEVWRGPSANRLGAAALGGAINFISPKASSAPGTTLSFRAGSFDTYSASGQTAFQGDKVSGLLQFEWSDSDGYRKPNGENKRAAIGGNIEIEHSEGVATQLFLSYTDLEFQIPGPLTRDALRNDPDSVHEGPVFVPGVGFTQPGPDVPRDQPRRSATQLLAGARTTFDMGDHFYDVGVSATHTDDSFRFPMPTGERATDGADGTLSLRYAYKPNEVAGLPLFEASLRYAHGESDREYYHVVSGSRGPKFGTNDLSASTLSMHAGANIALNDTLFLSPSLTYIHATRDNDDTWGEATRPTVGFVPGNPNDPLQPNGVAPATSNSYDRSYNGWSPALSLTWRPLENQTAWISVAHTFEPPTHDNLLATINGTAFTGPGRPNPGNPALGAEMFVTPDLKAQEADTLELGWRGRHGKLAWDVTGYYSEVENEILSLRDSSSAPRASINADKTIHKGLEVGLSGSLADNLSGRLAYTWQDFRFSDDPTRGNNRLGGSLRHLVTAAVAWEATDSLTLSGTVKWVPDRTPVDNMNTVWADPYTVVDLRAQWKVSDRASIFGEITNVFDENYASSTLVTDQANPTGSIFFSGIERAFFVGAKMDF